MATAKRVKQDDRVETSRQPLGGPVTSTFVSQQRTPQPDRIVLEMSMEEATAFERIVGDLPSGDALDGAYDAVADALEMSPTTGTQTSPAKDAAGGALADAYKTYGLGNR